MYDLIIVGGGPAGLTAAVYALQKRMETMVLAQDLGGKARYTFHLGEMEGHEVIAGREVVEKFRSQIEYLDFAYQLAEVTKVEHKKDHFVVTTTDGKTHEARTVIWATGARTEYLEVPGEKELRGRGVSYSAVSHAPMFLGREVAVYGKGPRALRAVAELSLIANKVTFLAQEALPESALTEHIQKSERVEILEGYAVDEVVGGTEVSGLIVSKDGDWRELNVSGLFVETGLIPGSEMVAGLVDLTDDGYIQVDCSNATRTPGLFAAGDVVECFAEQVLIAVGMGATAALSAYEFLLAQGRLPSWTDEAPQALSEM
jgi:alkyl hydroperoxide reductase subunit F